MRGVSGVLGQNPWTYTVNVGIYMCKDFRVFEKMGNFAWT